MRCRSVLDLPVSREVFGDAAVFATTAQELGAGLLRVAAEDRPLRRLTGQVVAARHTWDTAAAAHLERCRSLPAR